MPASRTKSWTVLATLVFGYAAMSAQAQEPPALAAIKDPAEKIRVKKLIDGARRENALSWIGVQFAPDRAAAIIAEFKHYYGLDALQGTYSYTPTGEIITRVEEMLRVKRNSVDIVWTSSWAWYKDMLERGEIMRYDSPYYDEYVLSHRNGMSEPGYWVSDAYAFVPIYNPAALEQRGISDFKPMSWADFVDPQLAGALSMIDPMVSTSAAPALAGLAKTMGEDWLKKLGANEPALPSKGAQGREWVGTGEFPITLFGTPADALALIERSREVELVFPKEGVVLIPFAPIILKAAPHPNSAKLFIDFVRSPYGTEIAMARKAGALLFFGRPGVKSNHPELQPATEEVRSIPFDWDVEGTHDAINNIRDKACAAGFGRERSAGTRHHAC
jgi:iron(III) transport system substrate-binding protein